MKKIFISRKLNPSSPICKISGDNQLIAQSLIQFSALNFDEPKADWIFFYSRNGVKYFFENENYELYPYLWASLSEGTADELSHYVTDISFVGNGIPEEVAQQYNNELTAEQVTCFVRAENSIDSINRILNREKDFSLPVYKNSPITDIPHQDFDILIFTSPMNVDAWFAEKEYNNEDVISIGQTTANHLASYDIPNVTIARFPSEASIAECLGSILG